ncbi:hypothetical protein N7474_000789 [Penicillium riverlandense]|uniref:uncharacterized protein n=1 Tax=Penicillium riverlandense TaxID=1903569 RepID=UPI0025492BC1|nr:uncharacterized protein N7474_000789 [Penicillium riverlandense]KAJ5832478.1 hypothetical protein N7474_000789 [Penicillium riverlandense]
MTALTFNEASSTAPDESVFPQHNASSVPGQLENNNSGGNIQLPTQERTPTATSLSRSETVPPEPTPLLSHYEGYTLFKADPAPGQKTSWSLVERTEMHLSQRELFKIVQKGANKVSAAQQYQNLSSLRRAHVNQLISEKRKCDPQVEWSCVYAKERSRPSKARNATRSSDYETVSMDIILMKRPARTQSYPRTAMGDLVDLAAPLDPYTSTGKGDVVQGPQPRPTQVTAPFTQLDLEQDPGTRTLHGNDKPGPHHSAKEHGEHYSISGLELVVHTGSGHTSLRGADHIVQAVSTGSSVSSSDEDDESVFFDRAGDSSATEDSETWDGERPEPRRDDVYNRQRSCSPNRCESGYGPLYRRLAKHRGRETSHDKNHPPRSRVDMASAKRVSPLRRVEREDNPYREKRIRLARGVENDVRSRMLDHREARIESWEKFVDFQARMIQKTIDESRELEHRKSFREAPVVCNCPCRRANNNESAE